MPAAVLARTGLAADQLDAVELLGGGSRIPAVQAAVSAALSERALNKCVSGQNHVLRADVCEP